MSEKLIPEPVLGRPKKYSFESLENYGDVVFVKTNATATVRDCAYKYGKKNRIKIATRKTKGGIKIYHAGNVETSYF